jgi:hypothetical protein
VSATGEGTPADVLEGRARWALVHGDCLEVLPAFPSGSIDVTLQDPPYEAEAHTKYRRVKISGTSGGMRWGGHDDRAAVKMPIDFEPITEPARRCIGANAARLTKRWALTFCQVEARHLWADAFRIGGHEYIRTGIWVKPDAQPQLSGDRPGHGYEAISITHPPGAKRWNGGGRSAVFVHARDPGKAPHPTTKPLALMLELVELFTEPDELVLDATAGGGSTGVACIQLGRRFIGIEKDAKYAAIARDRIAGGPTSLERAGQRPLFGDLFNPETPKEQR